MRHIIYESKENFISLNKEIEFVDNFIELQKIRTSDSVRITYKIIGEVPDAEIAPLLFEPFIDNAFKHGLPATGESDYIQIRFDFTIPGYLLFSIENNYEESGSWNKKNSGIGITNVKQRLKYLYKPKDYELNISKKNNLFHVSLQLKLK